MADVFLSYARPNLKDAESAIAPSYCEPAEHRSGMTKISPRTAPIRM